MKTGILVMPDIVEAGPQFEVTVPERTCCGRLARIQIEHKGERRIVYGNAIDYPAGDPMKARRVRIQRGEPDRHGDVVQPHEYVFLGWADEEED
jgi:hypothetical protein